MTNAPPSWEWVLTKHGVTVDAQTAPLTCDPFALAARLEGPKAQVGITLSTATSDYSRARLTVSVQVVTPQEGPWLNAITEAAFLLCKSLADQGADALGIPRVDCPPDVAAQQYR